MIAPNATRRDRQQRRQHANGRRLAGPVGTQKAEDLAGTDLQVQPAHRLDGPLATRVVLHKPFGPDGPRFPHPASCRRFRDGVYTDRVPRAD
jgi:hypothetical protein